MLLDFFVSETFEKIVFLGCSFKFGKSAPFRIFRKEASYCRQKTRLRFHHSFRQHRKKAFAFFCPEYLSSRLKNSIIPLIFFQSGRDDYFHPIERRSKLRFTGCSCRSRAFFQPCFPNLVHNVEIHHIGKPDCCR